MAHFVNTRILVIDDEPSMHDDFRSVLGSPTQATADATFANLEASVFGHEPPATRRGFSMVSAHQGMEGLELARAALGSGAPFGVAFVDMRMPPGWDGLKTVSELWKLDARLQVVFCTAYSPYSWEEALQQCEADGRLLVIKKPFDPIEIWQAACTLSAKWAFEQRAEDKIARLEGRLAHSPARR